MKCFLKGVGGGIGVLLAVVLLYPLYSDYRAAAETSQWMFQLADTKLQIERKFETERSLDLIGEGLERPKFEGPSAPSYVKVLRNGTIFLKGGREGQLVVLMPVVSDGKLTWSCVGGPTKATLGCRDAP